MKKTIALITFALLSGCVSTPDHVIFDGQSVGTYSAASGCGTLMLDTDCSQMSGSTRDIKIDGTPLRIASGREGKVIFIMSKPKFTPDETALKSGSKLIKQLLESKGIKILETKVMYGNGILFGVHITLDSDGYSYLKQLST